MRSILDKKRRIVLPKDVADELGLAEGTPVSFKKAKAGVIIQKVERAGDTLAKIMEWNPKRRGNPARVEEHEIKEIWG